MIIDSNLLVLLIVGTTGRELIAKHKRSRQFRADHYDRLIQVIATADRVIVTPNTLTEASNLLGQHGEPERSSFFNVLRNLIEINEEIVVASNTAAQNSAFSRLGLTDAVLLEIVSKSNPLVTTDLELYLAAEMREEGSALNFWHYQEF